MNVREIVCTAEWKKFDERRMQKQKESQGKSKNNAKEAELKDLEK